jgi:hypothetical protein
VIIHLHEFGERQNLPPLDEAAANGSDAQVSAFGWYQHT